MQFFISGIASKKITQAGHKHGHRGDHTSIQASEGTIAPGCGMLVGLVFAFTLGGFLSSNAVFMAGESTAPANFPVTLVGVTATTNTLSELAFRSEDGAEVVCVSDFLSPPVVWWLSKQIKKDQNTQQRISHKLHHSTAPFFVSICSTILAVIFPKISWGKQYGRYLHDEIHKPRPINPLTT